MFSETRAELILRVCGAMPPIISYIFYLPGIIVRGIGAEEIPF